MPMASTARLVRAARSDKLVACTGLHDRLVRTALTNFSINVYTIIKEKISTSITHTRGRRPDQPTSSNYCLK